MALELKHKFVSPIADNNDPNEVGPDEWNDDHDLTQATGRMLGRVSAGAGATEELTPTQVNTLLEVLPLAGGTMTGNIDFDTNYALWEYGVIGPTVSFNGVFFGYAESGTVTEAIGFTAAATGTGIYGPAVYVQSLDHTNTAGRQVYVADSGVLYAVDPPDPGWSVNDTDTGTYDLGTGAGVGTFIEVALDINTGGTLNNGDRLDVSWTLFIDNNSPNRNGNVEIGFGIDGSTPTTASQTVFIGENFSGYVSGAFSVSITGGPYSSGTNVSLWARRGTGSHSSWNPIVDGATGSNTHKLFVSVPGSGGSGATNFTGLTDTPTSYTGQANKQVTVNAAETALEFRDELATVTAVISGGGAAITTGHKIDIRVPFACTINSVEMVADQTGSIVVDIWKDTYANYPPTDADSITASATPTISAAIKSQDATLTGWTTAIAEGDYLRFNVDSAATIERVSVILNVTKT